MALALNILNEMENLRDLEKIFNNVRGALGPGRMFMFDMYTIEGLTQQGQSGDQVVYDAGDGLTVVTRDQYDYDRQIHSRRYTIFTQQGEMWRRNRSALCVATQYKPSLLSCNGAGSTS
jgi:hypothetical protein